MQTSERKKQIKNLFFEEAQTIGGLRRDGLVTVLIELPKFVPRVKRKLTLNSDVILARIIHEAWASTRRRLVSFGYCFKFVVSQFTHDVKLANL
jgi:hypothetical protein